jgi:hypothetical protein
MKQGQKKIVVQLIGDDAHTAYISLCGHQRGDKKVAKSSRLQTKGPMVLLDFDSLDRLIGIEIVVFESDCRDEAQTD